MTKVSDSVADWISSNGTWIRQENGGVLHAKWKDTSGRMRMGIDHYVSLQGLDGISNSDVATTIFEVHHNSVGTYPFSLTAPTKADDCVGACTFAGYWTGNGEGNNWEFQVLDRDMAKVSNAVPNWLSADGRWLRQDDEGVLYAKWVNA
jgi:hypothetical protein